MAASPLLIKAADPASTTLITPKTAKNPMNLIDQVLLRAAILFVARPLKELKKVADCKRIGPKIPLRIVCSRRKARSPCKGSHEPSYRCRFMFRHQLKA